MITPSNSTLAAQLLTVSILSLQRQTYHNRGLTNRTTWNASYDFIVIGGGTAGCIVAGRLSENPNVSVLLLEAGGPLTITSDMIPTFYSYDYNWGYQTVPQKNSAFGLVNRQVPTPRGKILGGSHALMLNVHNRGNYHDYDNWAHTFGATGWSYSDVLPFFLKSENQTDPKLLAANPSMHSTAGPIEVSTVPNPDPIFTKWLNIVHDAGWPITEYSDLKHQFGVTIPQSTQSATNWTRQTTAAGFIEVNIARPNLHVLLYSHATRLIFDDSTSAAAAMPTVTGVEFIRDNRTYRVSAHREVILSAGSINTPQLLMLNGIGPREHLTALGIPVIADLPVGSSLQDHAIIPFDFWINNASDITWTGSLATILNTGNLYDFFVNATGPLSRYPVTHVYLPTGISGTKDWPDGMMYLMVNQYDPSTVNIFDQANRDAWTTYLKQFYYDNRHLWFAFLNFRPLTQGTVRLASTNPFDAPLIDPNYFGNTQDLDALVEAISIGLGIVESRASHLFTYSKLPVPGCRFCADLPLSKCTTYIACVCRTVTWTDYHVAGSCPMGNGSRPAVVDARLRVRGVNRLRVIDSSIMPQISNGNPNAPTMMIGERGAALVKEDYNMI